MTEEEAIEKVRMGLVETGDPVDGQNFTIDGAEEVDENEF
jgi:hypothetical protein